MAYQSYKNFYIVGDFAYTEDNVLIYNLFIAGVPTAVTKKEATTYFSTFGKVKNVRFLSNNRNSNDPGAKKCGYVNYFEAEDAARALKHKRHTIIKPFTVKASFSWLQPNTAPVYCDNGPSTSTGRTKQIIKQPSTAGKRNSAKDITAESTDECKDELEFPTDQLNFLEMNDDCLEKIMKYLEIRDQLNLSLNSNRLADIFAMIAKVEYKNFVLDTLSCLNSEQTRFFFQAAGEVIESMTGSIPNSYRKNTIDYMSKNCRNLQALRLTYTSLNSGGLRKLVSNLKHLKELSIIDCSFRDTFINILLPMKNLECFCLVANYEFTGRDLHKLRWIQRLHFYDSHVTSDNLIKAFKVMPELRDVILRKCQYANSDTIEVLATNCRKLERLKITQNCSYKYKWFQNMPTLKHLEVFSSYTPLENDFFDGLKHLQSLESLKLHARNSINPNRAAIISELPNLKILHCGKSASLDDECLQMFSRLSSLEELVIHNCPSITNSGLKSLIINCKKLKLVDIRRCTGINKGFLKDMVDVLHPWIGDRPPISFHVYFSGILESDAQLPEYKNTNAFKVSFEAVLRIYENPQDGMQRYNDDAYDEYDVEIDDGEELFEWGLDFDSDDPDDPDYDDYEDEDADWDEFSDIEEFYHFCEDVQVPHYFFFGSLD